MDSRSGDSGYEGMVGIPALLGGDEMVGQAIVQVAGMRCG